MDGCQEVARRLLRCSKWYECLALQLLESYGWLLGGAIGPSQNIANMIV